MIPIKNEREIEKMRISCQAARTILERVSALIRPGVTTGEVDQAAADFMAEDHCKSAFLGYRGFPGNVCISVNEEVVHGIGGSRRNQYGDIVKLDIGVIKGGWVGDTATTVPVGIIDDKVSRYSSYRGGAQSCHSARAPWTPAWRSLRRDRGRGGGQWVHCRERVCRPRRRTRAA
jgi:methionine aminopeptidase